jgi:hypothetical protein
MSAVEQTAEEFFDSLNGFDEIAIKKFFGVPVSTLSGTKTQPGDPMQFMRALVFVAERRGGKGDHEAFSAAQQYSIKDVNENYFATPPKDIDPDAPVSESGKDEPQPEQTLVS